MGMIARLAETRTSPENPTTNLADPASWLYEALGGVRAWSGISVNEKTALTYATVYACVRILAESIGSLPLITYRRLAPRGKERAPDHYLYELLHDRPNPEIPGPMPFFEALQGHLATWGNAYAEIETRRGRPVALWPLPPDRTVAARIGGQKWIITRKNDGTDVRIPADRVLHIPGWGYDGVMGYSPISMLKQSIGLALAADKFGASWFSNGARPSGALKHPNQLSEEAAKRLKDSVEAAHRGLDQAHRLMILEEGLEWEQIGLPPGDAQFIESRRFQVEEIARAYRIPPVLLGYTEKATTWGSGVEQFQIMFVTHTLRPWMVRWEGALRHTLVLPSERQELLMEFLADALLRGDIETRFKAYSVARQWGWMSADDVREKEGQNPLPDGQGQIYLVPMNMMPADQIGKLLGSTEPDPLFDEEGASDDRLAAGAGPDVSVRPGAESRSTQQRLRTQRAYRKIVEEVANLSVRREVNAVRRAVQKNLAKRTVTSAEEMRVAESRGAQDLYAWLDEFYGEEPKRLRDAFASQLVAYYILVRGAVHDELGLEDPGDSISNSEARQLRDYVEAMSNRLAGGSRDQLRALMREAKDEEEMERLLLRRLDEWEENKAGKIGAREGVRAGNAYAVFVYGAVGNATLRWVTVGENCDFCNGLDGRSVDTGKPFVPSGGSVEASGRDPLSVRHDIGHPPLHDGCDCLVMAGGLV